MFINAEVRRLIKDLCLKHKGSLEFPFRGTDSLPISACVIYITSATEAQSHYELIGFTLPICDDGRQKFNLPRGVVLSLS